MPLGAEAQQGTRVYRIGYLATASSTSSPELVDTFRDGLRELGWVEGRNIHTVRLLGVELQLFGVREPGELDAAFVAMARAQAGAVLSLSPTQ